MSNLLLSSKEAVSLSTRLMKKIFGYQITQCIATACKLGLAEYLQKPFHYTDLAIATKTNAQALLRLLRLLCEEDIIEEIENGTFINTSLGSLLLENSEISLHHLGILHAGHYSWTCWENIIESLHSGQTSAYNCFDKNPFDYFQENKKEFSDFNKAMANLSSLDKEAIPVTYDFNSFDTVVDVGGGTGVILFSILKHYPHLKGILFDLAQPVQEAQQSTKEPSLSSRCSFIEGNFLNNVPAGGDCYLLRHIIHDWDEESALKILSHCSHFISKKGSILVLETILNRFNGPSVAHSRNMNMLVTMPGGTERSEAEYIKLFQRANLRINRIVDLPSQMSIMELTPCSPDIF